MDSQRVVKGVKCQWLLGNAQGCLDILTQMGEYIKAAQDTLLTERLRSCDAACLGKRHLDQGLRETCMGS